MTTETAIPAASGTRLQPQPRSVWQRLVALLCPDAVIAVVFVFAFALITIIWLGAVARISDEREDAIANLQRRNAGLAMAFEAYINQSITRADQVARALRREIVQHGPHIDLADYAAREIADPRMFVNLAYLDQQGNAVASLVQGSRENFADREYFRAHQFNSSDEVRIGKPVIGRISEKWLLPVSRRISHADGTFAGVVVVSIDPQYFAEFYRRTEIGRDGVFELVGLDGTSRLRQFGSVQTFGEDRSGSELMQAQSREPNGQIELAGGLENIARYVSYRRLTDYPLFVAVGISRDAVQAPLAADARVYYLCAAVANLVIAFLAFLLISSISRHKADLEELARSEARFRATFDQAAIGVSQIALDGRFLQVNRALCGMLGYSETQLLERFHQNILHPDDVAGSDERREQMLAGSDAGGVVERRYMGSNGEIIWVAISAALVRDADGRPECFVNMVECITERKKLQENLEHLARHDGLTQLPNRALFYNRLQQTLNQARRHEWITAVMFVDLDRFKSVNDTLGHAVGDELLQQVAARLMNCVRSEDTVGRLGGDEFAVILPEISHERDAAVVAQKIVEALARPFQLDKHEVYITASIGIETCNPGSCDADTMLSNADAAMYDAKRIGRNNYQFYAATMSERAMERLLMEKELRYAISRNEFLLNFQPKVNLQSGEISGFEALLRWHRTGGEIVSPAVFIPVIEECGLIHEVGEWVLRSACAQINLWNRAGLRPVPVAVNLSPKQFQCMDIGKIVRSAMEDHRVDPALLELEITESTAMHDAEGAIASLQSLKALGVRISIDDFGTGYSSLSYLTRFPIDSLKIDRSFVVNLPDSREGASIARAVITMAHALRLKVIAEGVENLEQLDFLADNSCDEMQGYYCSRPLPAAQATEILRGTRRLITRPQLVSAAA